MYPFPKLGHGVLSCYLLTCTHTVTYRSVATLCQLRSARHCMFSPSPKHVELRRSAEVKINLHNFRRTSSLVYVGIKCSVWSQVLHNIIRTQHAQGMFTIIHSVLPPPPSLCLPNSVAIEVHSHLKASVLTTILHLLQVLTAHLGVHMGVV